MRKKIALILGEITGNFQEVIMRAAVKRANELGYDTVSICTYGSYNNDIHFANGEKACAYIVDYSEYDGIIVSEDLFDIEGMGDEIYTLLKGTAKCPVVYTRTERDGCFSIFIDNRESMKKMTNHFIKDHGFTDICFMSGKKNMLDAKERLAGFMDAMEEAGLEVNENTVFHGDFWREKGKVAVDFFLKDRTSYPQAIVCANDFMALSVIEELLQRGIRVPEDICVSGFDYVEEARVNQPSLTSLNVDFEKMAIEAVNIIDRVNMAVHQDRITNMASEMVLHNSCGCGEQWQFKDLSKMLQDNYHQMFTMKNLMLSTMEYQDSFDEDDHLDVADRYFDILKVEKAYLCLCGNGEDGKINSQRLSSFPDKMVLKRIFKLGEEAEKVNIMFDRKNLLPPEYLASDEVRNLVVFSVHFKNHVYGYIVAHFPEKQWFDIYSQAYMLNMATAFENAMVQHELASFEQIKELYQKDSLTGLYNRRGFDKLSNDKYKEAVTEGKSICFVSIDMDSLKYVNDTYGHTEGDKAINRIANVIMRTTSENDVAARVGGDEFYVVLDNCDGAKAEEFIDRFHNAIEMEKKDTDMYDVNASIGVACLEDYPEHTPQLLMQTADMKMYEEKRSKKNIRNNSGMWL